MKRFPSSMWPFRRVEVIERGQLDIAAAYALPVGDCLDSLRAVMAQQRHRAVHLVDHALNDQTTIVDAGRKHGKAGERQLLADEQAGVKADQLGLVHGDVPGWLAAIEARFGDRVESISYTVKLRPAKGSAAA